MGLGAKLLQQGDQKPDPAVCGLAMDALESLEVGITIFDAERRLVYANPCFYTTYGLGRIRLRRGLGLEALIQTGHEMALLVHSESAPDMVKAIVALKHGETAHFEWCLKDARTVSADFRQMPNGGYYGIHRDLTALRQKEAKIKHLSRFDSLTKVANRFYFYETLDLAIAKLEPAQNIAVLRLDIGGFRSLNEAYGHDNADRLLQDYAQRLQFSVSTDGFVARLGGDEFAIIVHNNPDTSALLSLTYRLLEAIALPFYMAEKEVHLTSSIGIATSAPDTQEASILIRNADIALHNAKTEVPGAFRFFETAMDINIQIRRSLELSLDEALEKEQFELHYQPLIDLKTGMIRGAEALIRWNHPENGMISPAAFIPLAEETGQIKRIGDWVIKQACFDAAKWPEDLMVAVNLSPMQFKSPHLGLYVTSQLQQSGLKPSRLELEITESVMLSDTDETLEILHALRKLGVKIAMDDFGTGYSSLGYVQKFPFDKIKIDQSFVRDLDTNKNSLAIIRTIAQLGENLGIAILAEGIETQAQYQILKAENCPFGQGYLFSKPLPLHDFNALLCSTFGYSAPMRKYA